MRNRKERGVRDGKLTILTGSIQDSYKYYWSIAVAQVVARSPLRVISESSNLHWIEID